MTTMAATTSSSAGDAKARHIADADGRDILDLDRKTAGLGQDNILDVLNPVSSGDIIRSAGVDETDAANVDRLLTDRDLTAAHIDVGVTERADQLWHGDVVGFKLVEIGFSV